jgi:hypothetical protein
LTAKEVAALVKRVVASKPGKPIVSRLHCSVDGGSAVCYGTYLQPLSSSGSCSNGAAANCNADALYKDVPLSVAFRVGQSAAGWTLEADCGRSTDVLRLFCRRPQASP